MIDANILISIIIPVKNAEYWLRDTLNGIFSQTLIGQSEVILIDSGSSDGTIQIAREFNTRIVSIAPQDFNHGATRNYGATLAQGKFVVMTVQDATPVNEFWLQNLLDGFTDESVSGVCGLQIVPHDLDKNPVDWFRPVSELNPRWVSAGESKFDALSPADQHALCVWDNVNAMYRKDVLLKVPFQRVTFAEDALWAKDALRAGYTLAYNPLAQVKHYHEETPDYTFRRMFTIFYHLYVFFQVYPAPIPGELLSILRNIKLLVREQRVTWKDKLGWIRYNAQQRKACRKALAYFNKALAGGGLDELQKMHMTICKLTPQAISPDMLSRVRQRG